MSGVPAAAAVAAALVVIYVNSQSCCCIFLVGQCRLARSYQGFFPFVEQIVGRAFDVARR